MTTDRTPPFSDEAEMSLLGAVILDHEVFDDVLDILDGPGDFYRDAHEAIYLAALDLQNRRQSGDLVQL